MTWAPSSKLNCAVTENNCSAPDCLSQRSLFHLERTRRRKQGKKKGQWPPQLSCFLPLFILTVQYLVTWKVRRGKSLLLQMTSLKILTNFLQLYFQHLTDINYGLSSMFMQKRFTLWASLKQTNPSPVSSVLFAYFKCISPPSPNLLVKAIKYFRMPHFIFYSRHLQSSSYMPVAMCLWSHILVSKSTQIIWQERWEWTSV